MADGSGVDLLYSDVNTAPSSAFSLQAYVGFRLNYISQNGDIYIGTHINMRN